MEGNRNFRTPEALTFDDNISESWKKFKQKFDLFYLANNGGKKVQSNIKVAQLLNLIGDEGLEVFNSFDLSEEERWDFDLVISKFDDYCSSY